MTVVLHVTECYAGGVSRAINALINSYPSGEHHLLYAGEDTPPRELGLASTTRLSEGLIRRTREVQAAVEQLRPDVVHAHSSWAGVYARLLGVNAPVVYQPHCFAFEMSGPLKGMAFTIAERLLARRTAAFVAVSPHEVELCHMAKPDKETFLVPNIPSVAPSLTDNVTPPTGEIVMVGRLSEQKDPGLFASIARLSRQTHPGWRFVWVGDGDPTMRAELVKAGVEVTGWVTADEVSSRLRASFAYLHTAAWEGFPLSVLDALASKTPVLVRDIVAFDGVSLAKFSTAEQATSILTELTTKGVRARNILQGAEILESMNSAVQSSVLSECYDAVCNTRELAHA